MDKLQEEFVTNITSRMAVQEEKVGRLERIIYGLIFLTAGELVAIVFKYIH
jgi:hypothetical protein